MVITNKKAHFEYSLNPERVEAGLVLKGAEAKSIRENRASINEATVRILRGEAFLINANIPAEGLANYNATHARKLLLHRPEIIALETRTKQQKLTLVPMKLYTKGRLVKLQIALGKAKRQFEKRAAIKAKDIARELEKGF